MTRSPARKFAELLGSKGGNFAIMTSLALPVLFIAGSLALDTTNALSMKTRMQNAADSAALATSTRLSQEENLSMEEARAFAATFLRGQMEEDMPAFADMNVKPSITITPVENDGTTVWTVAVSMTGTQAVSPMARIMGRDHYSVGVVSQSQSASTKAAQVQGALSMALVLDRSGSMDWSLEGQRKIDVLKTAVGGLIDQFETADPKQKFVRIGAASYNTYMTGFQNLHWKPEKTRDFVDALPASGGTDSTEAFSWAVTKVNAKRELKAHKDKSGEVPDRFIVFMTDGDNNYTAADSSTKILCDKAKGEGIEVFTVAFAAPTRGKQLLAYCATSADHFYDANSSAALIAAFESIGKQASKVTSRLTQ
ncbi:TadE/TadG family type IV pilus assembly protein [uncultured Hoeflea sp.]|uniref:vWA domain-containing protein n=1 Tax=uncultured Hoeflea sp. TaxID=538666 RepID=UPI0030DB5683